MDCIRSIALLDSPALGLRRPLYKYSTIGLSRFENEEYILCFALRGNPLLQIEEHAFRCPWRVSLSMHGSYEKSIDITPYTALFGSHALRTKIIHCVLCLGVFTNLERETYILSSAIRLSCFGAPKSTVYIFRRYRALTL